MTSGDGRGIDSKKSISRLSIKLLDKYMSDEFDDFSKDRRRKRLARKRKEKFKKNRDFVGEDKPKRQRFNYRDIEEDFSEEEEYEDDEQDFNL